MPIARISENANMQKKKKCRGGFYNTFDPRSILHRNLKSILHSTSVRPVAQYQCPPSGTVRVSAQWHSTSVRPVAQYQCPPSGTVRVSAQWHSTSVRFNVKTKKKNGPNLGRRENYWVIQTTFTRRIFIFFCPKLYLATKN